ncbi:MAG TPA: Fic family protein, partial [Candidatus Latescibacteria bacterium]|nr:Fic family protein [Candidatus Latescibacterota bacterium]
GLAQLALRAEVVISGRLDGAAVSLTDLLLWELDGRHGLDREQLFRGEVRMAGNGVDAENWGLRQVAGADGISTALMMQLHTRLFKGLRGRESGAGQLRRSEIWIGPSGSTLATAAYVPPPPDMVPKLMRSLERFMQSDAPSLPPLVGAACIYYQLEAIHPFLDGSGRLARLMIPLILHREGVALPQLLGLSACFARDRTEHFRRLQLVRERGDWESWVVYFLREIRTAADDAVNRLSSAQQQRQGHRQLIEKHLGGSAAAALSVVDSLLVQPLVSVDSVARIAGRTFANANLLVQRLEEMGVLREVTGRRRNRRFCCEAYVGLLEET